MIEFRLPSLGADMDEGMLVAWLVSPGDTVRRGQVVAEVESDKGIIEVECWEDGVVEDLLVTPGPTRLPVGFPLARLRTLDEGTAEEDTPSGPAAAARPEALVAAAPVWPGDEQTIVRHRGPSGPPRVTPPVRHLAHQLGVDLDHVLATGDDGVVRRADIIAARSQAEAGRPRATPMARRVARERGIDLDSILPVRNDGIITSAELTAPAAGVRAAPPPKSRPVGHEVPPVVVKSPPAPQEAPATDKMAAMRAAIARSMARSKREIPHYYLATHVDLGRAMQWLEDENGGRPITRRLLPAVLLLKATALALREVPELNGHWSDDAHHPSADIHLGVAVSLRGGGLVAPAIHHADRLDLDELMEALRDLVGRARTWRIRSSEMSDPTITVTNLGDRGVETTFPVIIPPQVAIVGFGKIADQAVVVDGMIGVHPVVHASLAADHRVTDGHRGGLFLDALVQLLQEPQNL